MRIELTRTEALGFRTKQQDLHGPSLACSFSACGVLTRPAMRIELTRTEALGFYTTQQNLNGPSLALLAWHAAFQRVAFSRVRQCVLNSPEPKRLGSAQSSKTGRGRAWHGAFQRVTFSRAWQCVLNSRKPKRLGLTQRSATRKTPTLAVAGIWHTSRETEALGFSRPDSLTPAKSPRLLSRGLFTSHWITAQLLNSNTPAAFSSVAFSSALTGR